MRISDDRCGSVSFQGSYHDVCQDSSWHYCGEDCFALAVADGLGSCSRSQLGSQAVGRALEQMLPAQLTLLRQPQAFAEEFHRRWLCELHGEDPAQCCTTALFAVCIGQTLWLFRLGDGFLCAVTDQQNCTVLYDTKRECFINETYCLCETFSPEEWEIRTLHFSSLEGLVACTDGVGISQETGKGYAGFTQALLEEYRNLPARETEQEVAKWLSGWPGEDDKTLAFMIAEKEEL